MFAGVVVYKFVKLYVKEECIWGYFPLHESSLLSALLKGLYENKNIKNLSIDTYSKELIKEVYNSIGIDMDEVNLMLYNVKFNNKNTTEDALNFHRNNLKNDENVCIVTSLSDVNKQFDSDGIDNYMAIPTKSIIIESFQNIYLRYIFGKIIIYDKIKLKYIFGGKDMETIKVAIRITEEIRIKLEEYIVMNGLHRQRIKYNQLAEQIIRDWLKNPKLNKEKIIYGTSSKTRGGRVSINLTEEEHIRAYEIYVAEYIRECRSLNILLYNVLLQFVDNNFSDFEI